MIRWVLRAGAFVLVGAVFSLGLAWGLWIYLPMADGPAMEQVGGFDPAWRAYLPEGWAEPEFVARSDRFGRSYWQGWNLGRIREAAQDRSGVEPPKAPMYAVHVFHAGWPFRCIEGANTWSPTYRHGGSNEVLVGTIMMPGWLPGRGWAVGQAGGGRLTSELPYVIRWRGLAPDALLYAAAAWGLTRLWAWRRAAWRRNRGRCPACGYDVRGLGGCPECGPAGGRGTARPA